MARTFLLPRHRTQTAVNRQGKECDQAAFDEIERHDHPPHEIPDGDELGTGARGHGQKLRGRDAECGLIERQQQRKVEKYGDTGNGAGGRHICEPSPTAQQRCNGNISERQRRVGDFTDTESG